MIAEPIVLTGRLTYKDLLEVHRFRVRASVRPSILVLMGVVSGSLLTLLIYLSIRVGVEWHIYLIMGFFVYFPWGWLATREHAGRGRLRKAAGGTENVATFTADSASVASEDQSVCLAWKKFKEIVETREGLIFLLPRGTVWFYLPWRALHEKDREEILATAAAHGVRVRSVRRDSAR